MVTEVTLERMKKQNLDAFHTPQVGDYWHEMFCPYFSVVKVLRGDKFVIHIPSWNVEERYVKVSLEMIQNTVAYRGTAEGGFTADVSPTDNLSKFVIGHKASGVDFNNVPELQPARWALVKESFYYIPNKETFLNWMMSDHTYPANRKKDINKVTFPVLIIPVISRGVVSDYRIEENPLEVISKDLLSKIRASVFTVHPKGSPYVTIY